MYGAKSINNVPLLQPIPLDNKIDVLFFNYVLPPFTIDSGSDTHNSGKHLLWADMLVVQHPADVNCIVTFFARKTIAGHTPPVIGQTLPAGDVSQSTPITQNTLLCLDLQPHPKPSCVVFIPVSSLPLLLQEARATGYLLRQESYVSSSDFLSLL